MKKLLITIVGGNASGKSTIARIIELALTERGIAVEREDDNGSGRIDERPGVIEATADARLAAMIKGGGIRAKVQTCLCHE